MCTGASAAADLGCSGRGAGLPSSELQGLGAIAGYKHSSSWRSKMFNCNWLSSALCQPGKEGRGCKKRKTFISLWL